MNKTQNTHAGLGLGITGLIIGLVSLIIALVLDMFIIGLILGILGVTFSIVGLNQAKKANARNTIIMVALVLSIFGCLFTTFKLTGIEDILIKNNTETGEQDLLEDENEAEIEKKNVEKLIELEKDLEKNDTAEN